MGADKLYCVSYDLLQLVIAMIFLHEGGASTLQRGIVKTMTRGVNLDKSDFSGILLVDDLVLLIQTKILFFLIKQ